MLFNSLIKLSFTFTIKVNLPKHFGMKNFETRLKSYDHPSWPKNEICQSTHKLAEAGFYYTGTCNYEIYT